MLRNFVAVVQCGNLADAGVRLGRTPSAVSMTLKQLEDHLGAALFETDRKNRLTALGSEIFDLAQRHLREFDDTVGAMLTLAQAPQGILRIAAVPSVANMVMPKALEAFMGRHPALKVDLRDTNTDVVVDALLRGQADIGIVSGSPSLNGIRREKLFEDAFGIICAPDHSLAQRHGPITFRDLISPTFVRNNLCELIRAHEMIAALEAARLTVHNTLSLISMVRTGNWITVLPRSVVGLMPDQLVFRTVEGLTETREISLLIRERTLFPGLVEELADMLRQVDYSDLAAS
jgi:DNA-binding transcriptional LysR family regulator